MEQLKKVKLNQLKIKDSFWSPIQNLVIDEMIPYQEKILNDGIPGVEKSHALTNFRVAAGLEQGEFYGMVFQDSDAAKWLEGVAYSLIIKPDKELEKRADAIIDSIEKAQQPDGYLNTYFTLKEPEHRWQNLLECHELYCAGHMMEAAAAYYEATGKDKLLHVMERMADHIGERFGTDKERGIPGHQEIELGLLRLYSVTGKEKYLNLAKYFIDERGQNPNYFKEESEKRGWVHFNMDPENTFYNQSFAPVRQQETAEGHSVRAVYMYTAMADLAGKTNDKELYDACVRLWNNITQKRMYITGGIGSTVEGEAFTRDYDLPNDMAYAETCASIGLIFFAKKMLELEPSGKYGDVLEQALYNGVLSGMQMDGKKFFYVNPLEVNPGISGEVFGYKHVLPVRPGWYACACCPPNVVRLVTSLSQYAWSEGERGIYSHLFLGGEFDFDKARISVESNYPWEGKIVYHVEGKRKDAFSIAFRVPAWVKDLKVLLCGEKIDISSCIKDGYCYLERTWGKNDTLEVSFEMKTRRIYANTLVREDAGCVALMRGPFVYCFEGVDNGELHPLRVCADKEIEESICMEGLLKGITLLKVPGVRMKGSEQLYSETAPVAEPVTLTAIPYYAWGNRGVNQMKVWMLERN